jgi:uncharacterized phage-associated protein
MASVHDVAAALLSAMGPMSALKLQKLAYYCQAWHLARNRTPLFTDEVEAWREGPVVRALYNLHRQQYAVHEWPAGNGERLEDAERATVDWVVEKYGGFTPERLSRMTHNESPWRVARRGLAATAASDRPVDRHDMAAYYGRQQAEPGTAVKLAVASAALEGVDLDAEWQVRLLEVAEGSLDADDLIREETVRARRD